MGVNGSADAFCSTTNPSGIGASEFPGMSAAERRRLYEAQEARFAPGLSACSGCSDAEFLQWRRDNEINLRPMQVGPHDDVLKDRINPWTRDMEHTSGELGCNRAIVSMTCGGVNPTGRTKAPEEYMADMPDNSQIVLNSRGQCFLKDDNLPANSARDGGELMGKNTLPPMGGEMAGNPSKGAMRIALSLENEAARVGLAEESLESWGVANDPVTGMFPSLPSAAKQLAKTHIEAAKQLAKTQPVPALAHRRA